MKRPHIVHFITILQHGGAETVLFHLLDGLQSDFDQTVLYLYGGPGVAEVVSRGIPCYHVGSIGGIINPISWYRLIRIVQKLHPELLHNVLWSAQIMGLICAQLLKIRTIASIHLTAQCIGRARMFIERCIPYTYSHIITPSHSIEQSLLTHRHYKPEQITTIPNGLNEQSFRLRAAVTVSLPYKLNPYEYIIGTVGRLVPVKNQDLLIIAFAELHQQISHTRLIIIGSGPEENKLRALANSYGVHEAVTFIVGQDAAPYYRYFDCFVLPSAREGASYALLEALASHLCPIVTGILSNHTHELITDGYNGIVIPPNDVQALYTALLTAVTDQKLTARYKAAAKTTIALNSSQKMVQRYAHLFHSLL